MRLRLILGPLVAVLAMFAGSSPASATVPQNGYGLGISDPDPIPANSLRERFAALRPKAFRVIVDWNVVDNPALRAQVATRISRARAAGVREVAVAFGGPAGYVAPETWIAKVGAFVDEFSPYVSAWSPVNEPNHNPGGVANWLATTPSNSRPTPPHGYGVHVLARYSRALGGFLAIRHPDDLLLSPDLHDDYDGDLSDGTPLRTVVADGRRISTVADYLRQFRAAGGELGAALAWHPYSGVNRRDMTSTGDVAAEVPGLPIWVTEIGAAGQIPGGRFERAGEAYQQETVDWMLGPGLASHPQVKRIYYWHMLDHNPVWDTALVRGDGSPRPAWYSWCAATHGGDRWHPDCSEGGPVPARRLDAFAPGLVWRPPSGLIASGVTAVEPWPGRTVLLAKGPDSALWERRLVGRDWSPWRPLGGLITSEPSVESDGDGRITVSARGADGATWEIAYDGVEWSAWRRPSG
jgi:hypothetical protein